MRTDLRPFMPSCCQAKPATCEQVPTSQKIKNELKIDSSTHWSGSGSGSGSGTQNSRTAPFERRQQEESSDIIPRVLLDGIHPNTTVSAFPRVFTGVQVIPNCILQWLHIELKYLDPTAIGLRSDYRILVAKKTISNDPLNELAKSHITCKLTNLTKNKQKNIPVCTEPLS